MNDKSENTKTHKEWHAEREGEDWVCNCVCPKCFINDENSPKYRCICTLCTCQKPSERR